MVDLNKAIEIVLENTKVLDVEEVPAHESVGRVFAKDLFSDVDMPLFDNTAMDGYAFKHEDLFKELDVLTVLGAGEVFDEEINKGQAIRIMTGAPIPKGADTVVRYEDVDISEDGKKVTINLDVKVGHCIRRAGESIKQGAQVAKQGDVIRPSSIGILVSTGHPTIPVYSKPTVGLIALGTELVDSPQIPGPGMIRESNRYLHASAAIDAGAKTKLFAIVEDNPESLKKAFLEASKECDILVSSGGASVGDFDFVTECVASIGELFFNMVSIKPGKGQTFGLIGDDKTVMFGLSGNPGASMLGFELLVRPAIRKMQGYTHFSRPRIEAISAVDLKTSDRAVTFVRGKVIKNSDYQNVFIPASLQSSAYTNVDVGLEDVDIQSQDAILGYVVVEKDEESKYKGSAVSFMRLDSSEECYW